MCRTLIAVAGLSLLELPLLLPLDLALASSAGLALFLFFGGMVVVDRGERKVVGGLGCKAELRLAAGNGLRPGWQNK